MAGLIARQFGWECPKCGVVQAPWVPSCDCTKRTTFRDQTSFKLCLKCHTTYGAEQVHICPPTEVME